MKHVEENDVMIDFYLCPTLLQKEILDKYQNFAARGKERDTLIAFLEDKFIKEIRSTGRNKRLSA